MAKTQTEQTTDHSLPAGLWFTVERARRALLRTNDLEQARALLVHAVAIIDQRGGQ